MSNPAASLNTNAGAVAPLSRARPAFILWRHVIQELLPPTIIGFGVFTFLMLMRSLLQMSRMWIEFGAGLAEVLWAIVYSLPHTVVLTLPMGVLVGGLIAFGRMSSDFEIVALRALGVSLLHLLPPVLIFSTIMWTLTGYLFMVAMPWGNQNLREMAWETMTQRAFAQEFKPRVFHDSFPGMVLYIEDIAEESGEWIGVFVAKTDVDPPTILRAESAVPHIDEINRTTYLELRNGTVVSSAGNAQDVTIMHFEKQTELVWSEAEHSVIGTVGKDARSMTLADLDVAIAEREARGDPAWDLKVEVHKKYAFPFACIVMGLLSLPLGISTHRQATATGFGVGTVVIMVYYVLAQNGEALGDAGTVSPWLAMWAGNIFMLGVGLFLLWHKAMERDLGLARRLRTWWERTDDAARSFVRQRLLHRAPAITRSRRRRRLNFPRTLDRYVLRNYASIYALAFVALVLVVTAFTWLEKAAYVKHPEFIGSYLRFFVFEIIFDVIPLTAVVTVLATFSLMTKRSEVVAALAGGVSLFRLVTPILIPAAALTATSYVLQDYVLPFTTRQAEIMSEQMHPTGAGATLQRQETWVFSEGNRVFHFADYVPETNQFVGLHIYYLGDGLGGIARTEYANRAAWNPAEGRWEGHDGWRRYYVDDAGSGDLRPKELEEFKFAILPVLENPSYFNQSPRQPEEMSTVELRRHIDQLRERGYETHRSLVDFHLKIAQPFVVLVMTLVGIPFAFRMGRQGALTGVGVAITLAIVYWIAFGVFRALGYAGQLPPPLAAWAPHLLFMALAGYLALGVRT